MPGCRLPTLVWLLTAVVVAVAGAGTGVVPGIAAVHAAEAGLRLSWASGTPVLATDFHPDRTLVLERSHDLTTWTETARSLEALHPYPDRSAPAQTSAFYRFRSFPLRDQGDFATQMTPSSDRLFLLGPPGTLPTVRWCLLLNEPDRVYFQDSVRYPFHLDFARAWLPGYAAMRPADFYRQSLVPGPGQRMVVGTVMRAPRREILEAGIEITGNSPFPAEQQVEWVEAVRRRLAAEPGWKILYLPSPQQRAEAEAHRELFTVRGIDIDRVERWAGSRP